MKLKTYDRTGTETGEIDVDDAVFGIEPNHSVVHQAYTALMLNRRAGTAKAKRRYEVVGSGAKLRRQKGLGRARMGSMSSASRIGGGAAHGPRPHSFARGLPKKMRRLAIRSVLSDRASTGAIHVLDDLVPDEAKTRLVHEMLTALGTNRSVLLVTAETDAVLSRAARNLPYATAIAAPYLNVVDLANCHAIVATEAAIRQIETLWNPLALAKTEEAA